MKAVTGGRAATGTKGSLALLKAYEEAVGRSRSTGQPVRLVVDVAPRGAPTFTVLKGGGEAARDVPESPTLERALAAARTRGRTRVAEILREPDMLSADDFAALLGTSRVTVNTKRQNQQVLGLEGATRGYRFPAWQVDENGKAFGALPALFEKLGGGPWTVYRFLVQHHPELDGLTGVEALRLGRAREVLELAESAPQTFG